MAHRMQDSLSPPVQLSVCAREPLLSSAYHSQTHNHFLCVALNRAGHTVVITPHCVQGDLQGEEVFNWKDLKSLWQRSNTRWGVQIGEMWKMDWLKKTFLGFYSYFFLYFSTMLHQHLGIHLLQLLILAAARSKSCGIELQCYSAIQWLTWEYRIHFHS